jgi:hypothetical protein
MSLVLLLCLGGAVVYLADSCSMPLAEQALTFGGEYQNYSGRGNCVTVYNWACDRQDQLCSQKNAACGEKKVLHAVCEDNWVDLSYKNPTRCVENTESTKDCDNNGDQTVCYEEADCWCEEWDAKWHCIPPNEPRKVNTKKCQYPAAPPPTT